MMSRNSAAIALDDSNKNVQSISSGSFATNYSQSSPIWYRDFMERILKFTEIQNQEGDVKGVYLKLGTAFDALNLLNNTMTNMIDSPCVGLNEDGSLCFEWENEHNFFSLDIEDSNSYNIFFENNSSEPVETKLEDYDSVKFYLDFFRHQEAEQ